MTTPRHFPLAAMDRTMRTATWVLLGLPWVLLALPLAGPRGPGRAPAVLLFVLIGLVVLLWRPLGFELEPGTLVLRYPLRSKRIALSGLLSAEVLDAPAFRARFGQALRVGVGGLFGAFGWLRTTQQGWVEMDLSRADGLVLLTWAGRMPLVLTPEHPERFVEAVLASRA